MRARILLKANQGEKGEARTDAEIAEALDVAPKTVFNIRRRWVEKGLEAALNRKMTLLGGIDGYGFVRRRIRAH